MRNCPVCWRGEGHVWLEKGLLRIVRCRNCAMLYANPVPAEFASGQYYDTAGAAYYLSAAKLQSDYSAVRFERELRIFRHHCRFGAVLDVGCSSGAFLFQLNQRFPGAYQIVGTDVSGEPLDYAESRGVPVARGDFFKQDFDGKKFEAVCFWAVLEHLFDPKAFMEKAWLVLRPTGFCFVLVPNMESLAVKLLGRRYRYIYPQHLNYFTATSLERLIEGRFDVLETRFTHFNPIVIWQDLRGGAAEVSNQERGKLLRRTTGYKQNPLLAPIRGAYRLAERGLARLGLADNIAMVLRKRGT